jgi:hypothetical protein
MLISAMEIRKCHQSKRNLECLISTLARASLIGETRLKERLKRGKELAKKTPEI